MRNLKLFTKIFLYTFLVMLFVTVMAHVFLYVLAPQMTVSTNRFVEGAIIESDVNTGILIKSAIPALLRHHIRRVFPVVFQSHDEADQADCGNNRKDGKAG